MPRTTASIGFWTTRIQSCLLICLLLSLASGPGTSAGLTQQYCSSQNTADTPSSQSIYQSLGLCQTTCRANYAIAVVRGQSCWCSNYIPEDSIPVADCNVKCPGYPYEFCGNGGEELFGYLVINEEGILGKSGNRSSSPKTAAPSDATPRETSGDSAATTAISSVVSSAFDSLTESSSKNPSTSATWTPSPVTAILTRTIRNKPVTQTVTSGPSLLPNGEEAGNGNGAVAEKVKKSGTSGGLIAGVVIGTIAGMALLGAAIFFFWRRRRQQQQRTEAENGGGTGQTGTGRPRRAPSVLSNAGLLDRVTPVPGIRGHFNNHGQGQGAAARPDMSERRSSRPLYYDQRLNPAALLDIDNNSRVSVNTIPDNRDFSRPLNVTNPDV